MSVKTSVIAGGAIIAVPDLADLVGLVYGTPDIRRTYGYFCNTCLTASVIANGRFHVGSALPAHVGHHAAARQDAGCETCQSTDISFGVFEDICPILPLCCQHEVVWQT